MSESRKPSQVAFRDFIARKTKEGGTFTNPKLDTLDTAVAQANAWIVENGVDVVNVETVVIPFGTEMATSAGMLFEFNFGAANLVQVVRVWHRV